MKRPLLILVLSLLSGLSLSAEALPEIALTPEWLARIERAAPAEPLVPPKAPRRVLVFSLMTGFVHWNTPHVVEVVRILGAKSGAFEVVASNDLRHFERDRIGRFDAIVLINTCSKTPERHLFLDALGDHGKAVELERNLIAYVAEGHGLVGIHGAIVMLNNSTEFSELFGGSFDYHPPQRMIRAKVLAPDHPISTAFAGEELVHIDEPYCFKGAYPKFNFHPLLEMELPGTTPEEERKLFERSRQDLPRYLAWIKPHGEGRVFYCSPSHNAQSFEQPQLLRFILNGIQYATGDLSCDDTPIGR